MFTATINTSSLNTTSDTSNSASGEVVHPLFVSDGDAESGPFVVEGQSHHPRCRVDGAAVTPSILVGDVFAKLPTCSGSAITSAHGYGSSPHLIMRCAGLAFASGYADGGSDHSPGTSTGEAETSRHAQGGCHSPVAICAGVAFTLNISSQGVSTHLLSVCRGEARSSVVRNPRLGFIRDQVVVSPTSQAQPFTILKFERQ